MNSRTLTTLMLLTAVTAIVPFASQRVPAAEMERREHKELPATPGGTLTLKAVFGAIEVKTHDQDRVDYEAVLKPGHDSASRNAKFFDLIEFNYQSDHGDVKITMRWKDGEAPRKANLNGRHLIRVPARYHVDVSTSGGTIAVEDLEGNVAARTSGGKIRLGKIQGPVKAQTSGGGITAVNIAGNADAQTSGGNITLGNVEGAVSARTSGGSIQVDQMAGPIQARTSGGSIRVSLIKQVDGPVELSTSGGSIRLDVPANFKGDLDASTSGGSVDCELSVEGSVKRHSIHGKINGGGPRVNLNTSGGSIRVASH